MSDLKLIEYVEQARQTGLSDEHIKENLRGAGWKEEDINAALSGALFNENEASSFNENVQPKRQFPIKWLVLAVTVFLIGGGIYFYFGKSFVSPSVLLQKEIPIEEEDNLYKDEKVVIMNLTGRSDSSINFKGISPDGSMIFYEIKEGDKKFIVINNKEGGKYDDISDFYSNNTGTQYAYVVKENGKRLFIVNDQRRGENYDDVLCGWTIDISNCGFSPDGSKFFYEARKDEKVFIVINDKEGKKYDAVWKFTFSPDGSNFAYNVIENGEEFVVVNDQEGKRYNSIDKIFGVGFSPDGTKLVYKVHEKQKQFIVVNNREEKKYDWVWYPFFSQDGKNLTYWAKEGVKCFIVENSKEGKAYDCDVKDNRKINLTFPPKIFSPDGKTSAYIAIEAKGEFQKKFIVIDDQKDGQRYDRISRFMFSLDSKNFAYIATNEGKDFAVVNDIEGKRYDNIYFAGFAPGGRFFYSAMTKEENGTKLSRLVMPYTSHYFIVIDEKEVREIKASHTNTSSTVAGPIEIVFSPNGENVVYYFDIKRYTETNRELSEDKRSVIVVNNKEEEFLKLTEPVFLNNNTIRYFAYDGENIYRITKVLK